MDDILHWLIFQQAPGLGSVQQHKLLQEFGAPEKIISADHSKLQHAGLSGTVIKFLKTGKSNDFKQQISWLHKDGNDLVTWNDSNYPDILKQIPDPPLLLYTMGNQALLSNPQFAIVGSRNPTRSGRETARQFARELVVEGFTITSGLALGIDYCAHQAALEMNGNTIAVMGNGLDQVYPKRHSGIATEIAEKGLLLSEFAPGVPPLATNFPRRNRIISGLSRGVLVVEAAVRSGSLITARLAAEQGREVFAIPGSIHNPLARGCHHLIKQGAKLTEAVTDILEEFNLLTTIDHTDGETGELVPEVPRDLDENCMKILEHISFDPVPIDKIIQSSGLTADVVSSMLLILEVQGVVSSSGGLFMRINQRKHK